LLLKQWHGISQTGACTKIAAVACLEYPSSTCGKEWQLQHSHHVDIGNIKYLDGLVVSNADQQRTIMAQSQICTAQNFPLQQ